MRVLCVIPARLGSSRLPRKPLCLLAGDPLIAVVASRALELGVFDEIVVATDAVEVVDAVTPLGVTAVLTGTHTCGTDRVAEVAEGHWPRPDVIVNLQGDEPFVDRGHVAAVIDAVRDGAALATLGAPLGTEDLTNRNRVKVVVDPDGTALRFARDVPASAAWTCGVAVLRHHGVYAYTPGALQRWAGLPPTAEEAAEGIEAMRPVAHGLRLTVARVGRVAVPSIDTEQDLAEAEAMMLLSERDVG